MIIQNNKNISIIQDDKSLPKIEVFGNCGYTLNEFKNDIKSNMTEWCKESTLIDAFILFNFMPYIYKKGMLNNDMIDKIKLIYEQKYGMNKLEQKYFNDIKSNPEIYREILEKYLQILTLSSERILNKSDLLCVH